MSDPFAPIAPQLKASELTSLTISENSTNQSIDVKDDHNNNLYKIQGVCMSLSERRELLDSNGKIIGQYRNKKSSYFNPAVYIGTPDNDKKCMLKFKDQTISCNTADIYMDDKVIGEASGSWQNKYYEIKIENSLAASVQRLRIKGSTDDHYGINVLKGVDVPFIVLITLALDEIFHDE